MIRARRLERKGRPLTSRARELACPDCTKSEPLGTSNTSIISVMWCSNQRLGRRSCLVYRTQEGTCVPIVRLVSVMFRATFYRSGVRNEARYDSPFKRPSVSSEPGSSLTRFEH